MPRAWGSAGGEAGLPLRGVALQGGGWGLVGPLGEGLEISPLPREEKTPEPHRPLNPADP